MRFQEVEEENGKQQKVTIKFYYGTILKVPSCGTKLRIGYDNGRTETTSYPDDDIEFCDKETTSTADTSNEYKETGNIAPTWKDPPMSKAIVPDAVGSSAQQVLTERLRSPRNPPEKSYERRRRSVKPKVDIAIGQRVKVRFAVETTRNGKPLTIRKWYRGRVAYVTEVTEEFSKILIDYDDGTSELSQYPDKDIILEGDFVHSGPTSAASIDESELEAMKEKKPEPEPIDIGQRVKVSFKFMTVSYSLYCESQCLILSSF